MEKSLESLLLDFFGIQLRVHRELLDDKACKLLVSDDPSVNWQRRIDRACAIPMAWKLDQHEFKSHRSCESYLRKVLAVLSPASRTYKPYAIHNRRQLLTKKVEPREGGRPDVPFSMCGTASVLISSNDTAIEALAATPKDASPASLGEIAVVLQVKKPTVESMQRYVYQLTAELFATDWKSDRCVLAVLCDLQDRWTIQWLAKDPDGRPVLHRVRFKTKRAALTALAGFLEREGGPETYGRVKVRDLAVVMRL